MREFLRRIPLFADLPEPDLGRLCEGVTEVELAAGATLFEEGECGDRAFIVREGEVEVVKAARGRELLLAVRGPGDVIGEMALMEDAQRMATVRARTDCRLIEIDQGQMDRLLTSSPSAAVSMFHTVLARWRSTEAQLRQSEKMAQLGTLTAGVAHELNNPAAAVGRGADQLQTALVELAAAHERLSSVQPSVLQLANVNAHADRMRTDASAPPALDALSRADREAELEAWLDDAGVDDAWRLAPALTEAGLDVPDLDGLTDALGQTAVDSDDSTLLAAVLEWLVATHAVHRLLAEINQGATRIGAIVGALKSYAYLDQAPVQQVDVNKGIDDTLLILRGKLGSDIDVSRHYDPQLPSIQAYGSELNQVWTNLLDNAADALAPDGGTVTITTRRDGDWIVAEVCDDGPGIPAEIQDRIFDPFFTTKPVGQGTGLGLDITYGIVVNRHRGEIHVRSLPGSTCFEVRLPVHLR